jgi:hypothetical protein
MGWDGLTLVGELSAELSDISTTFKGRVLGWLNDIQDDICNRYQWPFLKKTGTKILTVGNEIQSVVISAPIAPTATLIASGSLTIGSIYSVKVSYYNSSDDQESLPSLPSSLITCSSGFQSINIVVPISTESITSRKIYLSKDSGPFYYVGTIGDNTTATYNITSETASLVVPLDYAPIRSFYGSPYLTGSVKTTLSYKSEDDIRFLCPGDFASGAPEYWAERSSTEIILYPKPSAASTMKFVYIKIANRIILGSDSQPILPINFKEILKAGVLWKGYEYRERSAAASQRQIYEDMLITAISTASRVTYSPKRIRDVNGNCDGFVV